MDKLPSVAMLKIESVELFSKAQLLNVTDSKSESLASGLIQRTKYVLSNVKEHLKEETDKAKVRVLERVQNYASAAENFASQTLGVYQGARTDEKNAAKELEQKRADAYAQIEGKHEGAVRAKDLK